MGTLLSIVNSNKANIAPQITTQRENQRFCTFPWQSILMLKAIINHKVHQLGPVV